MFGKNKKKKEKHPSDELIQNFFDWNYDIHHSNRRRAKVAYYALGFMTTLAFLSVLAVNALTPLKEIQPLPIIVDKSTGIVEIMHDISGVKIDKQEALDKYFVGRFINAWEGYSYFKHSEDRDYVLSFSDGAARQKYNKMQHIENPEAFVNTYKDNYERQVNIKEVIILDSDRGIAQIRFYINDGRRNDPDFYTTTLQYTYLEESVIPFSFLLKNPLGFVVTEYKVDKVSQ